MDNTELEHAKMLLRAEIDVFSEGRKGLGYDTITREFLLNEMALYRVITMKSAKNMADMVGIIKDLQTEVDELKGKSRIITPVIH